MTSGVRRFVLCNEFLRLFCQPRSSELCWRCIGSLFESVRIGVIIVSNRLCPTHILVSRIDSLSVVEIGRILRADETGSIKALVWAASY
jgi:hypothetical protein